MAGIAGACSAGLVFKTEEACNSGASLFQYNGLRPVESKQATSVRSRTNGFISTSAAKCSRIKAMSFPTVSAPKRETDPKKRIVITGMGLVSVFGNDIDTFYNKLLDGESGITLIDRFDASTFSVRFAGQIRNFSSKGYIDGKNDRRLDDCWRYCLVAGKRALEDAKLRTLKSLKLCWLNGTQLLNFDGLCNLQTTCFYAAANHIRRGEADIMVAGGTEAAVMPSGIGGFIACRALSQRNDEPHRASRPWDKDRDGFVMGEGSGVLIMESLEHAMKRGANIIGEYLGGAVTCDAHHMTDPRADGLGVSSCITKALEDAGVSPEEVNYVNAHATSTLAGDLAESMIGHGLGAAGGLEAIATIKAINTGWLHPTINQNNLEPDVTVDTVPNVKKQHEVNVGTNSCHLLIKLLNACNCRGKK
ncbi:hypothetical protein HYC85_026510 [Camellia sinensis]|uniref:beta-ketoacyl-[acyl-carrier-protein] synthase I n=1 Tax=Camellia sinensis TaxID=4442 RepID=A0A7J7G5Y5_CAMSI|nr:hypothetical protein HYC85_026510 [Camellia sinensis]